MNTGPGPCIAFNCLGDTDFDGVCNAKDNCVGAYNPDQADQDGNGIGDVCDDGDGDDFVLLRSALFKSLGEPGYDAVFDHDDSGLIGGLDFEFFRSRFGSLPGPSGLACAGVIPCTAE